MIDLKKMSGDWGGAAVDAQKYQNVYLTARQMVKTAKALQPQFIVNTGDNFYWCGIQNISDFQIKTDWLDPYSDSTLQIPWYSALGNHEYGYNVDAQLEMAKVYPNWIMDDRYYTRRFQIDAATNTTVTLLVIDTNPCIAKYRSKTQSGWDPCGTTYPTCSLGSSKNDDFEGPCYFNANILEQSCDTQYAWLQRILPTIPTTDWLIINGHHPLDEVDVLDFTSLIQARGFSIYLNGHTHVLTHYTIDNKGVYVTSGAGSLVNTVDQSDPITVLKTQGAKNIQTTASHTYQTVYTKTVAGFTEHVFSDDFQTLTTNFIDYNGNIIHTFKSNKAGSIVK